MAAQEQATKLQELSDAYSKLQSDLQSTVSARQRLESQQQENLSVQSEFKTIPEDAGIFKLVGPVLVKQDRHEANMAVDGRLTYIDSEIKRIEGQIKGMQDASEEKKMQVFQLQSQMQQQQQQPAQS